ncbi:hypothetical protein PC129_g14359 [Phytophthora cactorum]|uniref:Uncharacterized protein n=1 Tax=Phytophthora cactorum TaxID=29920 RepID=A0A8T1ALT5_9STRA|nr:hypothetical protein Pcac1_g942 [Phytophthora cactorum]KAG2873742.1 hypothetical protein PC114_g25690 [Phytophthora cactorum]KAG2884246.1 hypothetical protein PC117_g25851 [Phytophthora cactorum]KAG3184118.1 hypothetical protein C6341_g5141 [Phytophthora cactorum]KAG3214745.1 hypothetical protein PC129_g14359 [Phytophthora cactorum]
MTFNELAVSASAPETKLKRAFKTGTLSLTKDELSGSGATLHLHPESYAKALRAQKSGKGTRLAITHKDIGYPFKHMQGGGMHGASIWSKMWGGIKSAFKFGKDSGILSRVADAAVPALATALGAPQGAIPARAAIRSMTGIGVYDSDSDTNDLGGRLTMADVKKGAKRALAYTKRKRIFTDAVDAGEKFLLSKTTKPEHGDLIKSLRGEVRRRYGVGIVKPKFKRFAKGFQEAMDHMVKIRDMKKSGGSFRM